VFLAKSKIATDTSVSRYKDQFKDSLKLEVANKTVKLKEDLLLTANTPFGEINTEFAELIDKDTLPVSFTQKFDTFKNELKITFDKKEDSKYALKLFPGAITDFLGNTNDTLVLNTKTLAEAEYGKLLLKLRQTEGESLIVQLVQGEDRIIEEAVLTDGKTTVDFESIKPGDYSVRIIFDDNKNGVRDTGNYLKNIQPEKIFYYPKPLTVRANWDVKQDIIFTEE